MKTISLIAALLFSPLVSAAATDYASQIRVGVLARFQGEREIDLSLSPFQEYATNNTDLLLVLTSRGCAAAASSNAELKAILVTFSDAEQEIVFPLRTSANNGGIVMDVVQLLPGFNPDPIPVKTRQLFFRDGQLVWRSPKGEYPIVKMQVSEGASFLDGDVTDPYADRLCAFKPAARDLLGQLP